MLKRVLDIVWGLIAFVALLAVSFFTRQQQDIRPALLMTCFAFFAVAFHRAVPDRKRLWLTMLLVCVGGIVPVIAMNQLEIAFTDRFFMVSFLLASVAAAAFGVGTRWLAGKRGAGHGVALGFLFIAGVLAAIFVAVPRLIERDAYQAVSQRVTPFNIQILSGGNISSNDWKGRVVVLSFWATWCTPCQAELPEIAAIQAKYKNNPNVLILALNSGNHGETPEKATAYLKERKLVLNPAIDSFGVAPDEDTWGPAAKSLQVTSIPDVFILDRSGSLRVIHIGYDSSERLAESLSRQIDVLL